MKQAALFLAAGGLAAAVNVASRMVYSLVLPLAVAVVLAYLTGMILAFFLNRWFVFGNARDDVGRRAGRFALVNLLAVAQTLIVTLAGTWLLKNAGVAAAETVAHVIGVLVPVFSSYLMHKRWTFASKVSTAVSDHSRDS